MKTLTLALLVCAAAACSSVVGSGTPSHGKATTGGIAGLARDHDSGDPVAKADISLRGLSRTTTSSDRGLYDIDHLAPGRYELVATFAGQTLDVSNIEVRAGEITMVDLVFTLGHPEDVKIDFGNGAESARIDRYHPRDLAEQASRIEGTVSDVATRRRVPGAVVYARDTDARSTETVCDDRGHFAFDPILPGTYTVSTYYSVGGRGQIEVRRSDIAVAGKEAVVVPLWIETQR